MLFRSRSGGSIFRKRVKWLENIKSRACWRFESWFPLRPLAHTCLEPTQLSGTRRPRSFEQQQQLAATPLAHLFLAISPLRELRPTAGQRSSQDKSNDLELNIGAQTTAHGLRRSSGRPLDGSSRTHLSISPFLKPSLPRLRRTSSARYHRRLWSRFGWEFERDEGLLRRGRAADQHGSEER